MLDLRYIGSFQPGTPLHVENPLEELWSWVARLGISEWLQRAAASAVPPITTPWADWGPYAVVRIRQAVEFRTASRGASLLTRPLPLYYSFLNLVRGCLALEKQITNTKSHGLRFRSSGNLLDASAEVIPGTFPDWVQAMGTSLPAGSAYTLMDCLSRIAEISGDHASSGLGQTEVRTVRPEAFHSGRVLLHFHCPGEEESFRQEWKAWFPSLGGLCSLEPVGAVLAVGPSTDTSNYEAISAFCFERLWVKLNWSDRPIWFALRHIQPVLPRSAYYLVCSFILASAVRYEPELLLSAVNPDADIAWILNRLLNAGERYFPQLILHWVHSKPVFF